jgi:hypothetical protein
MACAAGTRDGKVVAESVAEVSLQDRRR